MRPEILAMLLCGCRAISPEHAEDPEPTPAPTPSLGAHAAVIESDADAPSSSTSTVKALPYNCQAPLAAIEEVTRLLTVAATHATTSSACVDGPGRRIAIDEILVCPMTGRGAATMGFAATYRVTAFGEGGQGFCKPKCPAPEVERARIDVTFTKTAKGYAIELPARVPGLPADATKLDAKHDGDCYSSSQPFEARPVSF